MANLGGVTGPQQNAAMMANQAGFSVLHIQRLQEPSTKYTLRAFLAPIK